jgi:hypothetical protein
LRRHFTDDIVVRIMEAQVTPNSPAPDAGLTSRWLSAYAAAIDGSNASEQISGKWRSLRDRKTQALALRVSPSGAMSWVVEKRDQGRKIKVTLGR